MNAIAAAKAVTAMIPTTKPKARIFGAGETAADKANYTYYGAMMCAAIAAWQYAAAIALNDAMSSSPDYWIIDYDNFEFIKGVESLVDLEAMCAPSYPWTGKTIDQAFP